MSKLKICLVSYTYPPFSSGGGDVYAFNIVQGLKKLNHEVLVISSAPPNFKKEYSGIQHIPIHDIPFFRIQEFLKKAKGICSNLLKSKSIDIFHFNGPTGCALYGKKMPTVMTLHHSVFSTFKILMQHPSSLLSIDTLQECNPYNMWLENKSMKSVNQIIAVSHHTASQLRGRGIPDHRINVVHNGIEIFPAPSEKEEKMMRKKLELENKKVLLFVGRLDQRKGAIFLVKAIKSLKQELGENFKCIIVGDGPQKTQILEYINKNNLYRFFSFVSKVNYNNLRKLFYLCDLLVLPSLYEGLGLVILEAMASKKPVIGSNSGGIPEIIQHGNNGFLIPLGSIEKLMKAIKKILFNEDLARKMGENGYNLIQKKFTWDRAVKETLDIYRKILK